MSKRLQSNLLLLSASMIWGLAFVAQRQGMAFVGPFTFNGLRFALGALGLMPLLFFLKPVFGAHQLRRGLLSGSLVAGIALFLAASFQQMGMVYTTAGNAGFVTSLYIVFVPLFGFIFGQRSSNRVWIGAFVALAGLYLLSVGEGFVLQKGDLMVFVSAVFWAIHLILLSHFAPMYDFRLLAIIQYVFVAVISLVVALVWEMPEISSIKLAAWPILYAGLASVGLGFTLQLLAQRHARADHAALILSLEAVFAFVGGWIILNETSGTRAMAGCALIFMGVIYSQLNFGIGFRMVKHAIPKGKKNNP